MQVSGQSAGSCPNLKWAVEYAGFLFDTFRLLMLVLENQQAVLLEQGCLARQ
jgi:hypothetical protein